jgi:hypothetical protein
MPLHDVGAHEYIAQLAAARIDALLNADTMALENLLHDDLVHIHTSARIDTKRSFIESVATRGVIYERFEPSDVRIIKAGADAFIRTGFMTISVAVTGIPKLLNVAFMEVWTKTNESCQLIAWQSTTRANPTT